MNHNKNVLESNNIVVLPSWHEGLLNAMIEAMAGLATIVTSIEVIPDFVKDGTNGILVPPYDIESLEIALTKVAVDV